MDTNGNSNNNSKNFTSKGTYYLERFIMAGAKPVKGMVGGLPCDEDKSTFYEVFRTTEDMAMVENSLLGNNSQQ